MDPDDGPADAKLLPEGALITFVPLGARLNIGHNDDGMQRSIAMEVELENGESVQLPRDRSRIYRGPYTSSRRWSTTRRQRREGAMGFRTHFDERRVFDRFSSENLSPQRLARTATILGIACRPSGGHLPNRISVRARGLSYGWQPDGSEKVWDTAARPHLPVIEIDFSIPMIASTDPLEMNQQRQSSPGHWRRHSRSGTQALGRVSSH